MTQRNKFPSNRLSNCSNICPEFANHKSANLSCCMVYYSELHCLFLLSLKFYLLYHYNIRIPRYRKFYQDPFVTCTEQKCDLSAIISKCFTVKTLASHVSYPCSFSSCCTTRSHTFPYFPMYPEGYL